MSKQIIEAISKAFNQGIGVGQDTRFNNPRVSQNFIKMALKEEIEDALCKLNASQPCVGTAKCYDCGLDYQDLGYIEAIIPDQVWNDISPTGDQGGILCIVCISRRLAERGYKDIPVWFLGIEPLRPVLGDAIDNKFKHGNIKKLEAKG